MQPALSLRDHVAQAADRCKPADRRRTSALVQSEARAYIACMSDRRTLGTVADIPADRLVGVIQLWLWEFEEPWNWPTIDNTRGMIEELRRRPDACAREVTQAIRECEGYIAEGAAPLHRIAPPDSARNGSARHEPR